MKSIITSSFNFVYNNKNPWIHKANELLHSAIILRDISIDASKKIKKIKNNGNEVGPEVEVIIKDWSIFNQATLLFGFFLENILKGIWIDKKSDGGNPEAFSFPRALPQKSTFDYSFSGLKTAVLRLVENINSNGDEIPIPDIAASFERVVAEVLVERTINVSTSKSMDW